MKRLEQLQFTLSLLLDMAAARPTEATLKTIEEVRDEIRRLSGPGIPCS